MTARVRTAGKIFDVVGKGGAQGTREGAHEGKSRHCLDQLGRQRGDHTDEGRAECGDHQIAQGIERPDHPALGRVGVGVRPGADRCRDRREIARMGTEKGRDDGGEAGNGQDGSRRRRVPGCPQNRETGQVLRGHRDQEERNSEPDQGCRLPGRSDEGEGGQAQTGDERLCQAAREGEPQAHEQNGEYREGGIVEANDKEKTDQGQDEAGRGLSALEHRQDEADENARQHGGGNGRGNAFDQPPERLDESSQHDQRACQNERADRRMNGDAAGGCDQRGAGRRPRGNDGNAIANAEDPADGGRRQAQSRHPGRGLGRIGAHGLGGGDDDGDRAAEPHQGRHDGGCDDRQAHDPAPLGRALPFRPNGRAAPVRRRHFPRDSRALKSPP